LIAGWFALRGQSGPNLRLFLTTGILGGYTTFSAFSLDAALLWERGEILAMAFYVSASVALSLLGVFVGLAIIRYLPS
jgi:CrcB protein